MTQLHLSRARERRRLRQVIQMDLVRVRRAVENPPMNADPAWPAWRGSARAPGVRGDHDLARADLRQASGDWVPTHSLEDAMLRAEVAERSRIATAVHDDTVQVMAATLVVLDRVAEMVERYGDARINVLLADARAVLSDASERTRRLAFELWPVCLRERGLAGAIATLVTETGREIGAHVSVCVAGERFEWGIEQVVFRTVQEAVANIRKHSRANHIVVDVRKVAGRLVAVVDDDGRGFDVVAARSPDRGIPHMGLQAMIERVQMHGGTMHIDSSRGSGTRVAFQLPLRERPPRS
jgi:two-component system sensor histidine kinase DegS